MPPLPSAELPAWRRALRTLAQTARLAVGIPDYEGYVAHRHQRHPGEPVMSYEEFFRERLAARYRRGSSRCC
jgi:uncharacterized short protein YbdD (DUF466 family)